MSAPTDRTTFLRRSLQLDGFASGLGGVLLLAAAAPITMLEVVGPTRRREMAG